MAKLSTIVGVDVGESRVGISISEKGTSIALPSRTLSRENSVKEIVKLIEEMEVSTVVIGWPLELAGRASRATRRVEKFEQELKTAIDSFLNVEFVRVDERLSTVHALNLLDEAKVYGKRRKEVVDQVAAVQILESYLALKNER